MTATTEAPARTPSLGDRIYKLMDQVGEVEISLTSGDVAVATALAIHETGIDGEPYEVLLGAVERLGQAVDTAGRNLGPIRAALGKLLRDVRDQAPGQVTLSDHATALVTDPGVRILEGLFRRVAELLNRLAFAQDVLAGGNSDEIDATLEMMLHDAKAVRGALLDAGVVEAGADGSRCVVPNAAGTWRLVEGVAKGAA